MATILHPFRKNKKGDIVPVRIVRELNITESHGKHRGRTILVEINGAQEIRFKIKGTRQSFSTHLEDVFLLAKIRTWMDEDKTNYENYLNRKKNNKNVKKPKVNSAIYFYSSIYREVLRQRKTIEKPKQKKAEAA